jgi:hypothetical protein
VNSLKFKRFADQRVEVAPTNDDVPSKNPGVEILNRKSFGQFNPDRFIEKGDLSFVIWFVIKEAIAANTSPRDTFDGGDFAYRMFAGRHSVMPEKVVAL